MDSTLPDEERVWAEAVREMRRVGSDAVAPRPRLSITEIAEANRVIPSESSSVPGMYSSALTPYTREIQDMLHPDNPAQVVAYEAAAQAGCKTTTFENWLLAVMGGYYPARMLVALDTDLNARDWSKDSLDAMITASPLLRERVRNPVSRQKSETVLGKWFPGGRLRIVGAHSASALCRMAAKYVAMDEVDRWKANVGYEGAGVSLLLARQTTFGAARKAFLCSTPTVENDSEIHEWFLRGDQRYYHVPCPRCGEFQPLDWRDPETKEYRLIWTPGRPDEAHYVCRACGAAWDEADKNTFLPAGRWVPSRPDLGGGLIVSFHLNALYAPLGWLSWGEIAAEWEAANAVAKTGSIDKLRSFVNVRLAQVFAEPGEAIDAHELADRVEPDWGEAIPEGVRTITCGTDVQDNRVETVTVGWGLGWEAWILDYSVILSDPRDEDAWARNDAVVRRVWRTRDGRELRAAATCVDSGYLPQRVLEYCRPRLRWHVYAIKGEDSKGPIWDRRVRHSGKGRTRAPFFLVHTIAAKDDLAAYLRVVSPGPKYVHIPDRIVAAVPDFLDQLTAERRVRTRDRKGNPVVEWKKVAEGRRNEVLDTMVYALAAAHSLVMGGLRLEVPVGPVHVPLATPAPVPGEGTESPEAAAPTAPEPSPAPPARPKRPVKKRIDPFYRGSHDLERERQKKPFGDMSDWWTRRGPRRDRW